MPIVVASWMVAVHALASCAGGGARESGVSQGWSGDASPNVGEDASGPVEGGIGADGGGRASDSGTKADAGGPTCDGQGTFCGGHGVSGGDPGTLYVCAAKGAAPASSSKCTSGCKPNATPPDTCVVVDAGAGQPVCPGPGLYCGGDSMSGDPNTLYHCAAGGQAPASSQPCANGCQVMAQGTNDVCRSGQSCPGAGDYCGGDGVQGGDPGTLYHCLGSGQAPSGSQACSNGCTIEPAGTNDFCAATSTCPTAGDYCGNDKLGGPANVLYHCTAAGQAPASNTVCSGGCVVEPKGQNDVCAGGGGCSATGQAALNWEANQLNSGNSWSDYCLGFVNQAYQAAGMTIPYLQAPDANTALQEAQGTGSFVGWNGNCPCGAILFWSANSCNGEWGHVVICNGDGTVSTSGWPSFGGSTNAGISWLDGQECGNTPSGYILP